MALEIARRLVGGVWRTGSVDEPDGGGGGGGGGSQAVLAFTVAWDDDLDELASPGGRALFTPQVNDLIQVMHETVVGWDSADNSLGGDSAYLPVGAFQGDGTLIGPADSQLSAMFSEEADIGGFDETGDLAVLTSNSVGSWASNVETSQWKGLVRVRTATPICVRALDENLDKLGTIAGQTPTVGESRLYFFVYRPTFA